MRSIALAAVLLSACGPSASGTYSGLIAMETACDDGSGWFESAVDSWAIYETPGGATVDTGARCGALLATTTPNGLVLTAATCPARVSGARDTTESITSGALSVGATLSVEVHSAVAAAGLRGCQRTWQAALQRQ